ncbi:replication protein C [Bradyrhizobium sp. Arg62]|uniref:plasmid replication protein RepC n=1 Tax=Bradyrhizobium TaxID=374 RepID=UPI001E2FA395|nr:MULTISPECIES: plasmid replication protein RepC [Bradyrhizobium]MCC8936763.1 replication protein C [Bradyrhizobium ivorense]MCC8948594.1 replication protein C [Bradyrhizobium brasilense]
MYECNPAAPFGPARLSLATIENCHEVGSSLGCKSVSKWQVFRDICEARSELNLSDRTLAILSALLSFHPGTVLVAGCRKLVVYPSNRRLAARAHGGALSTLRRHLASLVKMGLLVRRDSPNGKRYVRRANGASVQAFGFDLSPLITRADEFARLADHISKQREALRALREEATLARRDIVKLIAVCAEEGVQADWPVIHQQLQEVVQPLPRSASREDLETAMQKRWAFAAAILAILQRHTEPVEGERSDITDISPPAVYEETPAETPTIPIPNGKTQAITIPIRCVVEACPDFADYAAANILTIQDMIASARLIRPLLGVSWSAWHEACSVMGEAQASATLAAILQRGDSIKNAGGYLRTLTRRTAAWAFSIWSMLMALKGSAVGRKPRRAVAGRKVGDVVQEVGSWHRRATLPMSQRASG